MSALEQTSSATCFGGDQLQFTHRSEACNCTMTFSIYLPPQAKSGKVPLLWWLSGLTCTDQNFVTKAAAQGHAAEHGVAVIAPDTSPRGDDVPDDHGAADGHVPPVARCEGQAGRSAQVPALRKPP